MPINKEDKMKKSNPEESFITSESLMYKDPWNIISRHDNNEKVNHPKNQKAKKAAEIWGKSPLNNYNAVLSGPNFLQNGNLNLQISFRNSVSLTS